MMAWAKDQGVENWEISSDGFVSFVSDPTSEFTAACGMEMTDAGPVGKGLLKRCKRFAFVATSNDIKVVHVSEYEGDPAGDSYPDLTLPPAMIEAIKNA
jgi:peroxiredoxin